jgi:tetratricopeptide (TPR) repeat protein
VRNGEAAFTELNRALAVDPNYAPALKSLAEYYYLTRNYSKAKDTYLKYLQNSEESTANKIRFAQILFKGKEYADALTELEDILKTDKSNVYLYRLAGYSYYEVGEMDKDTSKYNKGLAAMEIFLHRIDSNKIIPSDYTYLGKLQSKIPGHDEEAIATMQKALELDSSNVEIYKEIAMIYNKMRKYPDAIANFEMYISKARKPSIVDYYLLAKASYYGDDFKKADTNFAIVSEMKPDYAEAYLWRGHSNASLDPDAKTTKAKEFYEKYVAMVESTPDKSKSNLILSYDYLAKYHIKHDENAKAKEYLHKILALDPANKTAKEYLKQLK